MNVIEAFPIAPVLDRLRAAQLRTTAPRIAVLQALLSRPEDWFCAETLYRALIKRGVETSLGTVYRVMNEMAPLGLLLRRVDGNGKRFFRLRPDDHVLHRIVCRDTGRLLAMTDDTSQGHLASVLRSQGLMLADAPMTVQVRCVEKTDQAM
ncbi:MAG TPA: transcriptional repressor [Bordetella sp.]